jgi:hypothetical protein
MDPVLVRWLMTEGDENLTSIEDLFRHPAWQRYGACHGEDVGTFVPGLGGNFRESA